VDEEPDTDDAGGQADDRVDVRANDIWLAANNELVARVETELIEC